MSEDEVEAVARALEPKCRAFGHGNMPMEVAREFARAAIAAMQGWRTIDSAPKDERILGWDGEILTLDWNKHGGYWQQVSDSGRSSAYCPTHWRPLPEQPTSPSHGTMVSEEQ